eukprot:TRINITY_DN44097_c0_g1_i1.p1 TRINITY_DN44097_c0_g1~~TRINITY_DN44097_c0_g1_i1.p1  ORF type:complete len:320 (+),score=33.14 TRINITY_DN44097_c0_g1_i1:98-1057(+)
MAPAFDADNPRSALKDYQDVEAGQPFSMAAHGDGLRGICVADTICASRKVDLPTVSCQAKRPPFLLLMDEYPQPLTQPTSVPDSAKPGCVSAIDAGGAHSSDAALEMIKDVLGESKANVEGASSSQSTQACRTSLLRIQAIRRSRVCEAETDGTRSREIIPVVESSVSEPPDEMMSRQTSMLPIGKRFSDLSGDEAEFERFRQVILERFGRQVVLHGESDIEEEARRLPKGHSADQSAFLERHATEIRDSCRGVWCCFPCVWSVDYVCAVEMKSRKCLICFVVSLFAFLVSLLALGLITFLILLGIFTTLLLFVLIWPF